MSQILGPSAGRTAKRAWLSYLFVSNAHRCGLSIVAKACRSHIRPLRRLNVFLHGSLLYTLSERVSGVSSLAVTKTSRPTHLFSNSCGQLCQPWERFLTYYDLLSKAAVSHLASHRYEHSSQCIKSDFQQTASRWNRKSPVVLTTSSEALWTLRLSSGRRTSPASRSRGLAVGFGIRGLLVVHLKVTGGIEAHLGPKPEGSLKHSGCCGC